MLHRMLAILIEDRHRGSIRDSPAAGTSIRFAD